MATVAKSDRSTLITLASATAGPFDLDFRLFDDDGLEVYVNNLPRTDYTISATYVDGYDDDATITFDSDLEIADEIIIDGALSPRRELDLLNGAGLVGLLNIELARIWSALSEVFRKSNQSLRFFQAIAPVKLVANKLLIVNSAADGVEMGPDAGDIAGAQANAAAAAAFATAAETAETNAATSAATLTYASEAEAIAGTEAAKIISPLTLRQTLDVNPGALILLSDQTASADSEIEFTSFLDTSVYSRYVIEIDELIAGTDGSEVYMRISTDNGSSWDSGAAHYHWIQAGASNQTDAFIEIGDTQSDDTGGMLRIDASLPTADRSMFLCNSTGHTALNVLKSSVRGGSRLATDQVNGLQFYMSAGNITSGRFRLYGRAI